MECDLLAFGKRLSQQLNQISYGEKWPVVPLEDYQLLQEALLMSEQVRRGKV